MNVTRKYVQLLLHLCEDKQDSAKEVQAKKRNIYTHAQPIEASWVILTQCWIQDEGFC